MLSRNMISAPSEHKVDPRSVCLAAINQAYDIWHKAAAVREDVEQRLRLLRDARVIEALSSYAGRKIIPLRRLDTTLLLIESADALLPPHPTATTLGDPPTLNKVATAAEAAPVVGFKPERAREAAIGRVLDYYVDDINHLRDPLSPPVVLPGSPARGISTGDAYHEGFHAGYEGKGVNPHTHGTPGHQAFMDGMRAGQIEYGDERRRAYAKEPVAPRDAGIDF